jgi:hypothetical protein
VAREHKRGGKRHYQPEGPLRGADVERVPPVDLEPPFPLEGGVPTNRYLSPSLVYDSVTLPGVCPEASITSIPGIESVWTSMTPFTGLGLAIAPMMEMSFDLEYILPLPSMTGISSGCAYTLDP